MTPLPPPIRDLGTLLATLSVSQRPGRFCVATATAALSVRAGVEALIVEDEGVTAVCTVDIAEGYGWDYDFVCAWLTLDVFSDLEAVGLTAAVAEVLTDAGISCNVLAARHHDHLLVPVDRVGDAVAAIESLAGSVEEDR